MAEGGVNIDNLGHNRVDTTVRREGHNGGVNDVVEHHKAVEGGRESGVVVLPAMNENDNRKPKDKVAEVMEDIKMAVEDMNAVRADLSQVNADLAGLDDPHLITLRDEAITQRRERMNGNMANTGDLPRVVNDIADPSRAGNYDGHDKPRGFLQRVAKWPGGKQILAGMMALGILGAAPKNAEAQDFGRVLQDTLVKGANSFIDEEVRRRQQEENIEQQGREMTARQPDLYTRTRGREIENRHRFNEQGIDLSAEEELMRARVNRENTDDTIDTGARGQIRNENSNFAHELNKVLNSTPGGLVEQNLAYVNGARTIEERWRRLDDIRGAVGTGHENSALQERVVGRQVGARREIGHRRNDFGREREYGNLNTNVDNRKDYGKTYIESARDRADTHSRQRVIGTIGNMTKGLLNGLLRR